MHGCACSSSPVATLEMSIASQLMRCFTDSSFSRSAPSVTAFLASCCADLISSHFFEAEARGGAAPVAFSGGAATEPSGRRGSTGGSSSFLLAAASAAPAGARALLLSTMSFASFCARTRPSPKAPASPARALATSSSARAGAWGAFRGARRRKPAEGSSPRRVDWLPITRPQRPPSATAAQPESSRHRSCIMAVAWQCFPRRGGCV
mmetsp:Transcript_34420/g.90147  ORF Transcript_34420/g.90147 Transcript_34420/m.90147 type:complete len:207 (-) Transcript_34420:16-636(-)